jgi:capsular polysaccharide biosynthesis protein
MNLAETLRGLWRRWYVVVPGILLAAALAVSVWFMIPPGHERSSTQLLIPGAQSMPEGANPYLFLGGLSPAADVIVRAVGSENAANEVVEAYPGTEIEISRDTTTSGPVILITVTAASDDAAEEVLGLLIERTASVLDELQATEDIVESNRVTLLPLTVDSQSVLDQRNRFIAVAATGLAGAALTLFIAALIDGRSMQRRRRDLESEPELELEREPGGGSGSGDVTEAGLPGRLGVRSTAPAPTTVRVDSAGQDRAPDPAPVPSAR